MKYRIEHETKSRIRIRMYTGPITPAQEEILRYAFSNIRGVKEVVIYRQTGGCALIYHGDRQALLGRLDAFNYENVQILAKKAEPQISAEEMRLRKLSPELKRKLRLRILAESIADAALPLPVAMAYHAYQLITLKDI